MPNQAFNLEAYFKRINYDGPTDVSYETLEALHIAHTMNVPFENLDVILGRPILLDRESLFNKIVVNNRGGYCFEMNTFFKYVLDAMGFNATILLTNRTRERQEFASRTHQLLLVEIDGQKYIADVGFGMNGLTAPIRLEVGVDQQQFTHTYRLEYDEDFGYILQNKIGDEYRTMFAFKLDPCNLADCQMSNHYMATYPESFFRKFRMVTMPTVEGRITLNHNTLKFYTNGQLTETELNSKEELKEALKKHFNLDLDVIGDEAASLAG
ncbi:MAG: arylamine N-acetyltransferase family protein [Dethiobacteraceae bacterium]|jgi:N-hydroxyarylamine O-acetyltransferase|nr:arylamine N-acetyltransferase [Bacillota bacterium]